MPGRKIAKRKRHCLEICNLKWSKPGKKDVSCQVKICSTESPPSKITENVGTLTEISFALSSQSTLPKQVNTAVIYETCKLSPQKLHEFCVNFTDNKQGIQSMVQTTANTKQSVEWTAFLKAKATNLGT